MPKNRARLHCAWIAAIALSTPLAAAPSAATQIILSTTNGATLGGLTFRDGDVVEYNPLTNIATLFFSEDLFSNDANVDGFQLLGNGHYVLSAKENETLGGLTFRDGDLVDYDPVNDLATLLLAEEIFTTSEDVDAFSVLADGNIVLSTADAATFDGGLAIAADDLALYDPNSGAATLYFSGTLFSANENIDAVFAPEPGTAGLLAAGLAMLSRRRGCAARVQG